MNYCPNCGHKLENNSNFCPNCGEKLNNDQNKTNQVFEEETANYYKTHKEYRSIKRVVIAISAVLGIIILAMSIYSYNHRYDYYKVNSGWTRNMYASKGKVFNYNNLIRYPDDHIGDLTWFKGEVLQVIEDDKLLHIRVSTRDSGYGYFDDVMYVLYYRDNNSKRILEGDLLTVYGKCDGLITYESTTGKSVTIPSFIAEYILNHRQ